MKKVLLSALILVLVNVSFGQTILAGSELFEKNRLEGMYFTLSVDKKYIDKEWPLYLQKFGKVTKSKEVVEVGGAKIKDISSDPVYIRSKVTGDKTKTTVFCSFDVGNGITVTQSSTNYVAAEQILKEFYTQSMHNEDIRLAEKDAELSEDNYNKVVKTGDRLAKDIERNKREKENLLKKLDENKAELEKLLTDQESNKKDQENAKIALDEKKKAIEQVKKQ
ncbi:MAG: hypothetical protein MUF45_06890 [Spirosomaceae bacterium]|jgi:hypothetical protein|nr:hypothetical protein [Spirosomataceae bacterium]